jgi:hypothetical protein
MKSMKMLMAVTLVAGSWACGGMEMEETRAEGSKVRIPLVINGQRYSPEEAQALFGDSLTRYFVDEEAQAGGFAYAFTSQEEEAAFLQRWEQTHPRPEVQAQAGDGDSIFYENTNNGGNSIRLPALTREPDFTRFGCFFYTQCNLWNDKVSSVTPSRLNRYTIIFEHINYGGESYRLANGVANYNLPDIGWNDRISSVSYEY